MRQDNYEWRPGKAQIGLLEPPAAVGQPPRDVHEGNARAQCPPERQNEIGNQPEHGKGDPEDLALHTLDCKSFAPPMILVAGRRKNFGYVQMTVSPSPFGRHGRRGKPRLYGKITLWV